MARFIINEKVYDTDKMELIGKVKKWFTASDAVKKWFGANTGFTRECELYRSVKGNWLLVYGDDVNGRTGCAIDESEARTLLMKSDYETYVSLFGELEEA